MLAEDSDNFEPTIQKRKALIADDDEDSRLLLVFVLSEQGWEVIEASDGLEAVLLFEETVPDLVILDNRMPGMNGTKVYQLLFEKGANPNVILISAYPDLEELALSVGIKRYLSKGFDLSDFLNLVELAYAFPSED